jgi:cold shock CspA family protein
MQHEKNPHRFGKVLWFDDRLGFGAAKAASGEYAYVHYKDIDGLSHRLLREGQEIAFKMQLTATGLRFFKIRTIGLSQSPWELPASAMMRSLLRWLHKRGSVRYMWRIDGGVPIVNMIRYYLLVTPVFELYLHQFTNDDEPLLHDHPWSFISLLLSGGYIEHFSDNRSVPRSRWSFSLRSSERKHRVSVPDRYRGKTITLLLTGRRHRKWFFWEPSLKRGLTPREYGIQRGATLNTFTDFNIIGNLIPKVVGGTDTPTIQINSNEL